MTEKEYVVRFTVQYETKIRTSETNHDLIMELAADTNIPEDDETKYVTDTFEVDEIVEILPDGTEGDAIY